MPRQNPFTRRISSTENMNKIENNFLSVPQLSTQHPAKLSQGSLSDSALKVPIRPLTYKNVQSRTISVRPSRFIKASAPTFSTSSPMILNESNNNVSIHSTEMTSFIRLFDTYTQKMYMEGYLMKHNNSINLLNDHSEDSDKKSRTKMYVELSGSTLTLWDTEIPGSNVMPNYFQIVDTITVHHPDLMTGSIKRRKYIFIIQNKKNTLIFEASDELSMTRWISAIRLSCFEKQKLHQLFTFRLLSGSNAVTMNKPFESVLSPSASTLSILDGTLTKNTFLQVRIPGTSIWQKYWVVIVDKRKDESRSKRFGKKSNTVIEEQILLYETKKSKWPSWTLSCIKQAYAIYPESPQLIERGSMIRLECQIKPGKQNDIQLGRKASISSKILSDHHDENFCWFMADRSQLTIQWLLAVYDTFKLYGGPEGLFNDPLNERALNFGEPVQDINKVVYPKLFLETDDVLQVMNTSHISRQEIEDVLYSLISKRQTDPIVATRRPTGIRANSLPLITVITTGALEDEQQEKKSEILNTDNKSLDVEDQYSTQFKFSQRVADSSDESDNDEEDEEDDEIDSDDEPIGKKSVVNEITTTPEAISTKKKIFTESFIPDFDFGNGFDVPKGLTEVTASSAVCQKSKRKGSHRSNSISTLLDLDNKYTKDDDIFLSSLSLHTRKVSVPITTKLSKEHLQQRRSSLSLDNRNFAETRSTLSSPSPSPSPSPPPASASAAAAASTLFGDFNLDMDFKKILDEPSDHRKYSHLTTSVKLSSMESSRSTLSSNHRWDNDWSEQDYFEEEEQEEKSQYDDDYQTYNSDFDGPLIPSLGDHFAPQNSLLDNYLGEQLSAKEQIEYCKATGQPLIQVSTKKHSTPQGGLVGMISQREKDRKNGNGARVTERVNQHHAQLGQDRLERERERKLFEQRQQQFLKHQIIMYNNGYGITPIPALYPHPFMGPIPPMTSMGLIPPLNQMNMTLLQQQQQQQMQYNLSSPLLSLPPQQFHSSPINSPSSSPNNSNYEGYIRPIHSPHPYHSPMGYYYPQGRQSPSLSAPIVSHRRFSRTLLDESEESGSSSRTISPIFRKSPISSTSSGVSSVRS
ncbi:uncharacterized protein BX663DRAFT_459796 [Cokeromyces recurvatus]|uniref:uncharacterized protein n=1 Tax=Cokeromyces recurvatus TaxID=90255 RepID=UPI0022203CD1|nr:uncharacterized protein BX663DRAFT_459796 [Cokeromyces recurvatus]KAI7899757.1 hypothetical protein BX663DRAFT_459796 [Cokeromyces recurvatus]